jgi:hypothetical protein
MLLLVLPALTGRANPKEPTRRGVIEILLYSFFLL